MKTRIIERKCPDGKVEYVIQETHILGRWLGWMDALDNHILPLPAGIRDKFPTLKEAQESLCWFDGTKCIEKEMPKSC